MTTSTIKRTYDEWIDLLKKTNHEDMQSNSYDVWIEAFSVGSLLTKVKCAHAVMTELQLSMSEDFDDDISLSITDVKQIQMSMLKKVVEIINDQQA